MIAEALLGVGILFSFLAGIGIMRFRDAYNRMHAVALGTTFGAVFTSAGIAVHCLQNWGNPSAVVFFHSIVVVVLLMLTGSVSSHVIAKTAYNEGIGPGKTDEYMGGVK